ncbi:hypothetical protein EGYY_28560 [Eggerthella sp. YY7918]|nr:hypothetical protein EGYY_28560 [Eggerthella sp. YY7918]
MFEVLYVLAALATIGGFVFDVWQEYKRADDGGRRLRRLRPKHKKDRR